MACLNDKNLPYLVTYNPQDPQLHYVLRSTSVLVRKDDFDYFYIQFSCHNSFSIYNIKDIVPADIFSQILDRKVFLVVDNGLEPFLKSADGIYYNLVINAGIPAEQIIFMSSVPTMSDYVKKLAAKLNQALINVEWYSMFEYQLYDVVSHQLTEYIVPLQKTEYKKKYINFNRRWRLHRPLLVTMLHDRGLLDHGYVSLGESDFPNDNWNSKWAEMLRYYSGSPEILEILRRNEDVKKLTPMYLDTEDLVTNRAAHQTSTDQYYLDTYFSLITETTYHTRPGYDGVPFLSEKVFKSIAMRHPFVLATAPNSLQYLKELGYKTFSPLIDESYDLEIDDGKRMIKIVNEVERLCNLEGEELKTFLKEAMRICAYNFSVLSKKSNFIKKM